MSRIAIGVLVCLAIPVTVPSGAPTGLEPCLGESAADARNRCAESRLEQRTPAERLAALGSIVDRAPALVEALLGSEEPTDVGDVRLAAARADLLGQALLAQGRAVEAAEAFESALRFDEGTLRVRWFAPAGETRELAVGPGNGRLPRTARALLAAGRRDAARPLLARAVELGASEDVRATWIAAGGATTDGTDAEPGALEGPLWREALPDLTVRLFGGKERRLRDARGNVLLLDFWASWCEPCLRELPFIESLYASRRERGLEVLAINYHEDPQEALGFAQATGMTLPIGVADRTIERAFEINAMPTVIVADRGGRIRGRWAGYEDNVEQQLTTLVDELLDEPGPTQVRLGDVLTGEGALDVVWVRVARRDIEGATVVRTGAGPRVAVGALTLTLFDAEGQPDRSLTRPPLASRLRAADLDLDGVDELIGFRPGAAAVVVFDLKHETFETWEAPHPLFDVEVAPLGASSTPHVLLGTLKGLWRATPAGEGLTQVGEYGAVSGLRALGAAGPRVALLDSGAGLYWLDADLAPSGNTPVPPDAWTLVADARGPVAGVAPADVTVAVLGRFLPGEQLQAAIGTKSGTLLIADVAGGATRFRAALGGPIDDLAAGDADGDGLDDLVVVRGPNVALMKAAR